MISHELNYFVDSEKRSRKRVNSAKMAMDSNFDFDEHMEKYEQEVRFPLIKH